MTPISGQKVPIPDDFPPPDWPNRAASDFFECNGIRWHVQRLGAGPDLLLVHGTGGSTHSWSRCVDALAANFRVTLVDLPGHGFTTVPPAIDARDDAYSLNGMAKSLSAFLSARSVTPVVAAGHSAGVAVLLRMQLDGLLNASRLVGFNPALVAPPEWYVALIAPLLRSFFESDALADGGAWLARRTRLVKMMLDSSGSALSTADLARYEYLCTRPQHVHAALAMMSRWDLPKIVRDAVALRIPLDLIAGGNDRWVPFGSLQKSVSRIPAASLRAVAGAGHLLLEERPDEVIRAIGGGEVVAR